MDLEQWKDGWYERAVASYLSKNEFLKLREPEFIRIQGQYQITSQFKERFILTQQVLNYQFTATPNHSTKHTRILPCYFKNECTHRTVLHLQFTQQSFVLDRIQQFTVIVNIQFYRLRWHLQSEQQEHVRNSWTKFEILSSNRR